MEQSWSLKTLVTGFCIVASQRKEREKIFSFDSELSLITGEIPPSDQSLEQIAISRRSREFADCPKSQIALTLSNKQAPYPRSIPLFDQSFFCAQPKIVVIFNQIA